MSENVNVEHENDTSNVMLMVTTNMIFAKSYWLKQLHHRRRTSNFGQWSVGKVCKIKNKLKICQYKTIAGKVFIFLVAILLPLTTLLIT